ncbi:MAG: hypothetical protein AB7R89_25050 [Dehalococcoidia bacterium]
MRILFLPLVAFVTLLAAAGCDADQNGGNSSAASTTTPAPTVTAEDALVDAASFPGCTMQGQGSLYTNTFARSFDCENGDRLTTTIAFGRTPEEAKATQDNTWGTKDGATDQIRAALGARPVNIDSLTVSDASAAFGTIGADQENIWCAVYTDPSGTRRVTEFYGVLRYKAILVQYTAFTETSGSCEGSRALESARVLAKEQLNKLRTLP